MIGSMLHRLAGLLLPACADAGAGGLPIPEPLDMSRLRRPMTPNTALAAPAGFEPSPDIATRPYEQPPDLLYAAIRRVGETWRRSFLQVAYDDRRQAHYVVRSRLFNFPDLVALQVNPDSTLVIWSRSVYGRSDLGVNARRVVAWLAALDTVLAAG
jgi:hypothetical protein